MKELLTVAGRSKQAVHQYYLRQARRRNEIREVLDLAGKVRKDHKRMGCAKVYSKVQSQSPVGRDRFVEIMMLNGHKVQRKRNLFKTTRPCLLTKFPNLAEGRIVTGINQLWQSDLFYILTGPRVFYGFTVIDVYSRRLLALHIAPTQRASELEKATQQAILARKGQDLTGCIFHSDRGGQYHSQIQQSILHDSKMETSMCKLPQENAYVERVQGTLKSEYLDFMMIDESNRDKIARQIMRYYNHERPHKGLGNLTPMQFEAHVNKMSIEDRPKQLIYKWDHELLTKNTRN